MQQSNKKLTILYILEILKQHSDENHPLTQRDIVKKLKAIYAVETERKSIGKTIDSLIDFGYDIVKLEKGGCYLARREFEPSEIAFLIDAVFASKNISARHAKDLAGKLAAFHSVHGQKHFRYIHKADEINRTINREFFYNIDIINEAIDKGIKIEFKYNIYGMDKKLKVRKDKFYSATPYFMLNSNGKYYLVCNYDGREGFNHIKVDYITDIRLLNESARAETTIKGFEKGVDIARYANDHINMWTGEIISVTLRLNSEWSVSNVIDWFGNNARIYEKQEGEDKIFYADIKASENGILYWAIQFGDDVEVVAPATTRAKITKMATSIANKYKENE